MCNMVRRFIPKESERALTLVETTALAGLISLILLFTLSLIPSLKLSNRRANMELQAGNLAQSALEEQRSLPFSQLLSSTNPTLQTVENIDYSLHTQVSPGPAPHTKAIRVTVHWTWKEKSYSLFRETLLSEVPRA